MLLLIVDVVDYVTSANNNVFQSSGNLDTFFQRLDNITIFQDLLATKLGERIDMQTILSKLHNEVQMDNGIHYGYSGKENTKCGHFFTIRSDGLAFKRRRSKVNNTKNTSQEKCWKDWKTNY